MENNMDNILEQNMKLIRDLADKGMVDEAIHMADKMYEIVPESSKAYILCEKAEIEFASERKRDALGDFVKASDLLVDDKPIIRAIELFESDNKKYRDNYQKNYRLLTNYKYVNGIIHSECRFKVIIESEKDIIYYDSNTNDFFQFKIPLIQLKTYELGGAILFNNLFALDEIIKLSEKNVPESEYEYRCPFYLNYYSDSIELLMQIKNLEAILQTNRVVFSVGEEMLKATLLNVQAEFPESAYGEKVFTDLYNSFAEERRKQYISLKEQVDNYYDTHSNEIIDRIMNQKPRVMVATSRFNKTVNNQSHYLYEELKRQNVDTRLYIQCDDIYLGSKSFLYSEILDYKPDIVFWINNFRQLQGDEDERTINENLVWVCYVQDPWAVSNLNYINKKGGLCKRDVIMTFLKPEVYHSLGEALGNRPYITAYFPADENVYKEYYLSDEEQQRYGSDICVIGHQSDLTRCIKKLIDKLEGGHKELFLEIVEDYEISAYKGSFLYTEQEFKGLIDTYLYKYEDVILKDSERNKWVQWFLVEINQRLYRQVLVDWLIEEGVDGIKLWGEGWTHEEKYNKYAMGPADNGEELSKICQASKIVLGSNPITTMPLRVGETMLSGGFYLSNYIPKEKDVSSILDVFNDEEVAIFHDRKELIQKVKYYLDNSNERERMVCVGKQKALEKITYRSLVRKIIYEVPDILDRQINY